ncbi:DUF2268 domain-containing protein [Halobacillus salinus]|uniref:DUF2268 domain-containing protein n=1 Tax=Halobacillus salinus TaxID=192814 RepID=UPI0009A70A51|nr:DUF2268 domain-containing putative Zn-dependent protease [Halobacillus salinus]
MPVIDTRKPLRLFIEKCKQSRFSSSTRLQKEVLCDPSAHPFSDKSSEEIQEFMMVYGLFHGDQWKRVEKLLKDWEKEEFYKKVNKEFRRLRKEWNGPDVPLYVYPIHQAFMGERENKGGVAFKEGCYLFYDRPEKKEDWRSILAHEYHHVCRLRAQRVDVETVPLMESVVLEGMAEYAVYDQYGEDYTADWVNHHKEEDLKKIWEKHFLPNLKLKGQENHTDYLYGNRRKRLPQWIGYEMGYRIVKSYHEAHPNEKIGTMTKRSAKEIIKGSAFS